MKNKFKALLKSGKTTRTYTLEELIENGKDYISEEAFECQNSYCNYTGFCECDFDVTEHEIEKFLQYTGSKDKNGVEIYEGDIVKLYFEDEYSNDCVLVDGLTEKVVKIKFDYQGVYGEEEDQTWYYLPDLIHNDVEYEVIGNIYENKELLDGR